MTDTPIIDAVSQAARGSRSWVCLALEIPAAVWDDPACLRGIVIPTLRAALPWDLPAERLGAKQDAILNCDEESAWDSIASADCRNAALAAYRADPIMRELYPEKFK